ncbi:MAG TPA: hypothetical protein VGJ56_14380 [Reyranella sp.]|jgi:hypothetical protein
MVVPFRTFAVFSLAFGMLAAGYLIRPAPGATQSSPPPAPAPQADVAAPTPKAAMPTLATSRPPVPLVRPQPTNFFTPTVQDSGTGTSTGASNGDPADPAQAQTAALTTDQPSGNDADARKAIEFDGYKDVHGIVKDPDGTWHARAMRGHAEIAVTVDASGNVSAQ